MIRIRRNPLLGLIGGAALSLALLGCGSGGYSKPKNPPPTYPGSASSNPSQSTTKTSTTVVTSNVPSGNIAMPSARDGH